MHIDLEEYNELHDLYDSDFSKNDLIILKGTDMDLTISNFMFGIIDSPGEIVFSPQLVDEYLREINDEEIPQKK